MLFRNFVSFSKFDFFLLSLLFVYMYVYIHLEDFFYVNIDMHSWCQSFVYPSIFACFCQITIDDFAVIGTAEGDSIVQTRRLALPEFYALRLDQVAAPAIKNIFHYESFCSGSKQASLPIGQFDCSIRAQLLT